MKLSTIESILFLVIFSAPVIIAMVAWITSSSSPSIYAVLSTFTIIMTGIALMLSLYV